MSDKGPLSLEVLDLVLELLLLLPVSMVSLDLGVQSPVVELLGVGHQVMVPFGGADKKLVVPDWHGLDGLVDDLSEGGIEGGDIHIFIHVAPGQEVGLAVIVMAHPLGLHLETISNRYKDGDFTLVGFEVVGMHWFILLLVLGKATTDLIEAFFSSVELPLEFLHLLGMLFVAPVEGLEKPIDKAP